MCCFPLLPEDHIVLLNRVFNGVGRGQDLLMMLLGISLDTMDLCCMGSPFNFSIVYLKKEQSVRKIQLSFGHSPHPGFKFHYPGEEPERDGSSMPDRLGSLV